MRLSKLERAILDWIARRHPALASRLEGAEVLRREHTGVGFYVDLSPGTDAGRDGPPLDGPVIESSMLEFKGGSLLWLSRGDPHCLEIYAFGDEFPEDLDEFELSSSDGSA